MFIVQTHLFKMHGFLWPKGANGGSKGKLLLTSERMRVPETRVLLGSFFYLPNFCLIAFEKSSKQMAKTFGEECRKKSY